MKQQSKTEPQQLKKKSKKGLGDGGGGFRGLSLRTCVVREDCRGWRFKPRTPTSLPGLELAEETLAALPSSPQIDQIKLYLYL